MRVFFEILAGAAFVDFILLVTGAPSLAGWILDKLGL